MNISCLIHACYVILFYIVIKTESDDESKVRNTSILMLLHRSCIRILSSPLCCRSENG